MPRRVLNTPHFSPLIPCEVAVVSERAFGVHQLSIDNKGLGMRLLATLVQG